MRTPVVGSASFADDLRRAMSFYNKHGTGLSVNARTNRLDCDTGRLLW